MMFTNEENGACNDAPDTCYAYQPIIEKDQPDEACTYAFLCVPTWSSLERVAPVTNSTTE